VLQGQVVEVPVLILKPLELLLLAAAMVQTMVGSELMVLQTLAAVAVVVHLMATVVDLVAPVL
jgi:hypothetical protein